MADDRPGEMIRTLMMGIGGTVLYYATLEYWIDGIVATLFMRVDGAAAINRHRHPTNAKEEIEFMRSCAAALPVLAPYKGDIELLLVEVEKVSELRHGIVHGHLEEATLETGDLEFTRVRSKGRDAVRTVLNVNVNEIVRAGIKLRTLSDFAREIARGLIKAFGTEDDRGELLGAPNT